MPCQLITQKNLVARSFFIACNLLNYTFLLSAP